MRAACSEPGQAQSTHVHEHGNTVPPELADGDELDPVDAFAVIRRRIGLAIRVTRHNHPMPSGGLVWEVIKGSIDLSRAETVAGFFFQLPATGIQRWSDPRENCETAGCPSRSRMDTPSLRRVMLILRER